ncbi:MAG: VWA domain-containing protein, partial [Candidatus Thermoplasmatota archaeon]|nr:VWA domain-containing protein [Candidatus Thermoplasmatota archaeon]
MVEEGTKEKEMDQKLIQESNPEGGNEELKGYIPSDIKDVKPKNIWHTGVPNGQHKKGPFDTDEATVYLNLTGRGNPNEIVDPFDWVFSIDSSGSMDYNDENDMRIDAAQHFVDRVKNSNATGSRGASIDFDSGSTLINGHHLSDNYPRIKQDLENIDSSGGTDFSPPLQTALNEFQNYGNTSRHDASSDGKPGWFHIFLTDGEGDIDWSKVDAHSQLNIPIYTIGFGDVDDQTLIEMAQRTGGDYHYCTDASELDE